MLYGQSKGIAITAVRGKSEELETLDLCRLATVNIVNTSSTDNPAPFITWQVMFIVSELYGFVQQTKA
jgi:hypothetical protein